MGIVLLPVGAIAGFLWNAAGTAVPFFFGGSMVLLSVLILGFCMKTETLA